MAALEGGDREGITEDLSSDVEEPAPLFRFGIFEPGTYRINIALIVDGIVVGRETVEVNVP